MYSVTDTPKMLFEEFSETREWGRNMNVFFMDTTGFGN